MASRFSYEKKVLWEQAAKQIANIFLKSGRVNYVYIPLIMAGN